MHRNRVFHSRTTLFSPVFNDQHFFSVFFYFLPGLRILWPFPTENKTKLKGMREKKSQVGFSPAPHSAFPCPECGKCRSSLVRNSLLFHRGVTSMTQSLCKSHQSSGAASRPPARPPGAAPRQVQPPPRPPGGARGPAGRQGPLRARREAGATRRRLGGC